MAENALASPLPSQLENENNSPVPLRPSSQFRHRESEDHQGNDRRPSNFRLRNPHPKPPWPARERIRLLNTNPFEPSAQTFEPQVQPESDDRDYTRDGEESSAHRDE